MLTHKTSASPVSDNNTVTGALPANHALAGAGQPPGRFLEWWLPVLFTAVILGGCAARAERVWAPWLIFPIMTGATLGALASGWWKVRRCRRRTAALVGTFVAAAALTVAQHAAGHRLALQDAAARMPATSLRQGISPRQAWPDWARRRLPPASLWEFLQQQAAQGRAVGNHLARGAWVWWSWLLDAVLLMAGATIVVRQLTRDSPRGAGKTSAEAGLHRTGELESARAKSGGDAHAGHFGPG